VDDADRPDDDTYADSDALIDAALEAGEGEAAPPRAVDKFRRTALGSVAAAGLLGLRDALEGRPEKEETAVVVDAPTPKQKGPVEVTLDFEHPERSRVVIHRPAPESGSESESGEG
jgi:hypothetical protein